MAAEEVRLKVPAVPELLSLARVAASGVASRLGFTYDEVQDLRLAVDELCFALTEGRPQDGWLSVRYVVRGDAGTLEVQGKASFDVPPARLRLGELSGTVLGALVDEYEVHRRDGGGQASFRLVKRRSARP